MKNSSFYKFYQKVLKENTGQPQAGAGAAPPAPGTAPQAAPGAQPAQNATAPPVPTPDPGIQAIQQLLAPQAQQIQGLVGKITDPKMKQMWTTMLQGMASQQKPQQPQQGQQPAQGQPPAPGAAAKPAGQ
jgi:hypothetical protein